MYTLLAAIILLLASLLLLFLIYLIAKDAFSERLITLKRIGVAGIPNPDFFKWLWPFFILTSCIAYYIVSAYENVGFRWIGLLVLTILTAFFLFAQRGFVLWPFAILTLFSLILLIGESIFTFGIIYKSRLAAALLGFYFFWAIYALYIVINTLILFINSSTIEWR